MITVTLRHANGDIETGVLLDGVPREGDHIERADGKPGADTDLIVEQVTWREGLGRRSQPDVLVAVTAYPAGRRRHD